MKRFFSEDSFWNTPIAPDPQVDPDSDRLVALLAEDEPNGFGINLHQWTIPVYEVDASTPRRQVHRRMTKCDIGLQKARLSEGRVGQDAHDAPIVGLEEFLQDQAGEQLWLGEDLGAEATGVGGHGLLYAPASSVRENPAIALPPLGGRIESGGGRSVAARPRLRSRGAVSPRAAGTDAGVGQACLAAPGTGTN